MPYRHLIPVRSGHGLSPMNLAPLTDVRHAANVWANAIDPSQPVSDERELGALLAGRQMLIVLDNCEHVVHAAATAAEAVLAAAPGVRILTCSTVSSSKPTVHVCRSIR